MLEALNAKRFAEHIGSRFNVEFEGGDSVPLELKEVNEPPAQEMVEQFSLIFSGPATHVLPQAIHKLTHEKLGVLEIFLVAIGPDGKGMGYQSIFNRLRKKETSA